MPKDVEDRVEEEISESSPFPEVGDDIEDNYEGEEDAPALVKDDASIELSQQYGLSKEEAAEMSKAGLLEKVMLAIDRKFVAAGKASAVPATDGKELEKEQTKKKIEAYKIELDEADYDPGYVKTIKGINDHYAGQLKDLNEQVEYLKTYISDRQASEFSERFDSMLSALGDEYAEVFGKGSVGEIGETTPGYQSRGKLLAAMNVIAAGVHATGGKVPGERELFQRALRLEFSDKAKELAKDKHNKKMRSSRGRYTTAPTHRSTTPTRDPEAAARKAVAAKLREYGAGDEE